MSHDLHAGAALPRFDRRFFEGVETFTTIGAGALGGKAEGLRRAREALDRRGDALRFREFEVSVPTLSVIGTDVFDAYVERHGLRALAAEEPGDHHVARAFQHGELPGGIAGDLWDLVRKVQRPLAVRSSSLLEDAVSHPFAGVYGTKMTPHSAHDPETRFRHLVEAVKFVWASTFFRGARAAVRAAGHDPDEEKMAVIVQEVVGRRHGPRFYPDVSGVARSFNFYPSGPARPEEGVAVLALGLGKTIVEGGRAWTYSPAHPASVPPFNSPAHMLEETQTGFWAVHMGAPPRHDPIAETEWLARGDLADAEADGTLAPLASTWDPQSDRIVMGTGAEGPRVLDFAPLLRLDDWPLNDGIRGLLACFEERTGGPVEIEFAFTFPDEDGRPARLGLLQVRPLAVAAESVELDESALEDPHAVVATRHALGNGTIGGMRDVVFVRRDRFTAAAMPEIAVEVEGFDHELAAAGRPYLLVGFGRWGSSDPWLGVPVAWSQVGGARTIVESAIPGLNADMSQGAHFFHNLLGFGIPYLMVPAHGGARVDWAWIESLPRRGESAHVVHAEAPLPLEVRVDGRHGRAVVLRGGEAA